MKNNYLTRFSVLKAVVVVAVCAVASTKIVAQNDYTVSPIPYQVYEATASVQGTMDDSFSAPIPLTFNFDFYGATCSQVSVSTNGYISFTPYTEGYLSPWDTDVNMPIPDASFPVKNALMGAFHDLNNANAQGTITYAVIGSAPYRKFVVMFDNNSHFSCYEIKSSFQMVLYETLNIMDVQLIDKQVCLAWNEGSTVTGIINETGLLGIAAPNRNIGAWTAFHEGWRFQRPIATDTYLFAKCDDDADGFVNFNLAVAQNDLLPGNPSLVTFYQTQADAVSLDNPILDLDYVNATAGSQTIYANVDGEIKSVKLLVVACDSDYDLDSVATADEDQNEDTNLANDDTDGDGIANFIDNDDDGDMVLTSVEYVFNRSANGTNSYLDTDNDGILNYLDSDDDGDEILTINEDANANNNPADDDADANGTPDYLQNNNLAVNHFQEDHSIVIYPNPASSVLNLNNTSGLTISSIAIYAVNGTLVKQLTASSAIPVADLQSGLYFVKIVTGQKVLNYKFVKK
jgi:Secretion system C-terminal sorting domain